MFPIGEGVRNTEKSVLPKAAERFIFSYSPHFVAINKARPCRRGLAGNVSVEPFFGIP
jgi:hypothetical protein